MIDNINEQRERERKREGGTIVHAFLDKIINQWTDG